MRFGQVKLLGILSRMIHGLSSSADHSLMGQRVRSGEDIPSIPGTDEVIHKSYRAGVFNCGCCLEPQGSGQVNNDSKDLLVMRTLDLLL